MRVGLAFVGCAAFCLGVPPVAADYAPSATSGNTASATTSKDLSEPPGAFSITYKTTTPPAYQLKKAVKRGNRVELGLWKADASEYLVNFSIRAAGPALLDQLRIIGVPDPDAACKTVLARGTIEDSAAPMVSNSPRLVVRLRPDAFNQDTDQFSNQLPCRESGADEQDCFLTRGGQGTVTKLK